MCGNKYVDAAASAVMIGYDPARPAIFVLPVCGSLGLVPRTWAPTWADHISSQIKSHVLSMSFSYLFLILVRVGSSSLQVFAQVTKLW